MRCLNPILLQNVGIKKDKNLTFNSYELEHDPYILELDRKNKKQGIILAPCGKCYACKTKRVNDWYIRTIHEHTSKEYYKTFMYFITFTYNNNHIGNNSLDYRDIQLFMKKLRKEYKEPLKFLCVGEYGYKSGRKHFHMVIFGFKKLISYGKVNKMWSFGNLDIDIVRSYSAVRYLLKYSFKDYKINPILYKLDGRTPPMFRCSKNFGKSYCMKNYEQIFEDGYIQFHNIKYSIPRYYRKFYNSLNLIDNWDEYDRVFQESCEAMLLELREYSLDFGLCEIESLLDVKFYLDKMRPIKLELNKKLFDNHFKNFHEKL